MCSFCNGKKRIKLRSGVAFVEDEKYLVVKNSDEQFIYDLGYCPECGAKLNYWEVNRVYVTNITADEIIKLDDAVSYPEYDKHPLHHLVCDKSFEKGKVSERQVGFIISDYLVAQIKEHGYCDLLCWKGYLEH